MPIRTFWGVVLVILAGAAFYLMTAAAPLSIDPRWALEGDDSIPDGALTVRFTGTSTLLFSDGETAWMVDGWFSRFGPLALLSREIAPDVAAIERGLERNGVDRLAVVIPVHSHFDHAMDAPEVARRTGAVLWGSESTANIGRGWGLEESQIRVAVDREPVQVGRFTIRLIATEHFEFPDPEVRASALGDPMIEEPLVPPVGMFEYRVGQPYAIHVSHPEGTWLIQGSAGYRAGGLAGFEADTVFLGVGGLGSQTPEYREAYWRETVETTGARRIIPIHFDSLMAPIEGPFLGEPRGASFLSEGDELVRTFLEEKLERVPGLEVITLPRYAPVVLFR